ncbi:MAG: T9SS type A sorting domain-containing protein, partial [Rhodothermales bacterium]|nr:T9SS type A sorting domain-containing protein [Rhodothermales bacterium]
GGADGFAGHLLVRSDDFGDSWRNISPIHAVDAIDFGGTDAKTLVVSTFDRVSRSLDGGETWLTVLRDSARYSFTDVLFDPASETGYVATTAQNENSRIMMTKDNGETWRSVELPVTERISEMQFGVGANVVLIATPNEGVFRVEFVTVDVESDTEDGTAPILEPVYPNPAPSTATFSFEIRVASIVSIDIHDALGRLVASIPDAHMLPGKYVIPWSTTEVAGGVYYCTLHTSTGQSVREFAVRR